MAPRLEGCHKDGDFQRRGPPTLISVHTDDQQKNIRANVLRVFIKVPKYGKHRENYHGASVFSWSTGGV